MLYEIQGRRCAAVVLPEQFISASEIANVLILRFPAEGRLRVRKVVTRSRERQTIKYPSWKIDRMVECDSPNELVAARIYDCDPTVISFHEQAIAIRYVMNDEVRIHIPDFVVRREACIDIDEIKDESGALDTEIKERTAFLKPLLAQLGLNYRVREVSYKRFDSSQKYCRAVLRYGRTELTAPEREAARRLFARSKWVTWGQIVDGCLGTRSRYVAARLLLEGRIQADDCQSPLRRHTRIFGNEEAKGHIDLWAA